MNAYQSEIDSLFKEWKDREPHKTNNNFIKDGIIDIDRWNHVSTKVLFILREAYQHENETDGFNLVENLLAEEGQKKGKSTWRNLGKWAYLLQNYPTENDIENVTRDWFYYEEAFLSSAIINVKKSGGKSRSDIHEIIEIAKLDQDLLRKQVDLISPDIICCCGVFGSIKVLWNETDMEEIGHRLFKTKDYKIIDYWHPATLWSQDLFYFGLKGIIEQ